MVPIERCCGISEFQAHIRDAESVTPVVQSHEEVILIIKLPLETGVQIVKVDGRVFYDLILCQGKEQVCIRPAGGSKVSQPVICYTSLNREATGYETYSPINSKPSGSVGRNDLQQRRKPASKTRWYIPFVECHSFHCISIEYGKKAKHVGHIVQCGVVKEYHVLIGAASANMKTAASFRGGLYSGKHLYHFQQVHFSEQRGNTLNDFHIQTLNAHL